MLAHFVKKEGGFLLSEYFGQSLSDLELASRIAWSVSMRVVCDTIMTNACLR